jgi:hypothetical protein
LIDSGQRGLGFACFCFGLSQKRFDEWEKNADAILLEQGSASAHPQEAGFPMAGSPIHPAFREAPKAIHKPIPCSRAMLESLLARGVAWPGFWPTISNITLCIST